MSEGGPDLTTALDEVKQVLLGIVKDGEVTRPEGIHLTWVGGEFARRKHAPFEQYVNFMALSQNLSIPPSHRKMAPFVQTYCADILEVRSAPKGGLVVSERKRSQSPVAISPQSEFRPPPVSLKFKKGVWVSFIRSVPAGKKRYLNLESVGFTDLASPPPGPEWKEIPLDYITGTPPSQPIDGALVQSRIRQWAMDIGVDIDRLVAQDLSHEFRKPSLADLARIVESLPVEVAARWSIPAEVLRHLQR